jgi:hypothetical protein
MRRFTSWAVGAVAFASITSFTPPAVARDGFYVDPSPPGVGSYTVEEYCRDDPTYRLRHLDRCSRYLDGNGYYRDSRYYDDRDSDDYRDRHRRHRHHHDRDDDRERDRDY